MKLFVSALLVLPLSVQAQALGATIVDVSGPSEVTARRAQKALDGALRSLSGAAVKESIPWKRGAPRACGAQCVQEAAAALGVPAVTVLDLKGSDTRIAYEVTFVLDGVRGAMRKGETSAEALEGALKAAVEQVLPGWLRKGFGAVALQLESGSVVKVDGRVVPARSGELLPTTAGVHQVDVVFPSGNALLQRLEVPEGARVALTAEESAAVTMRSTSAPTALRYASYGFFVAGAATIAAGFVAGALSKSTGVGLTRCEAPEARDCSALADVLRANQQAQQYASLGNLLLILGASAAALGVGLFSVDSLLQ